jgi:GNAT superfamily N-acetyltransferase
MPSNEVTIITQRPIAFTFFDLDRSSTELDRSSTELDRSSTEQVEWAIANAAPLYVQNFREYPLLVDLDVASAKVSLRETFDIPGSHVRVAIHHQTGTLVGFALGVPVDVSPEKLRFWGILNELGLQPADAFDGLFTFIHPLFRGLGISTRLEQDMDDYARAAGFKARVFSQVDRPPGDPRAPADYRRQADFYSARGYVQSFQSGTGVWPDLGDERETQKTMLVFGKRLDVSDPE